WRAAAALDGVRPLPRAGWHDGGGGRRHTHFGDEALMRAIPKTGFSPYGGAGPTRTGPKRN
ncbi:MAG: hypothetical protein ACKOUM_06085, partial [Sphingopyxis sp.]